MRPQHIVYRVSFLLRPHRRYGRILLAKICRGAPVDLNITDIIRYLQSRQPAQFAQPTEHENPLDLLLRNYLTHRRANAPGNGTGYPTPPYAASPPPWATPFDRRHWGSDFASRYAGQDFDSRYAGLNFDTRNADLGFDARNAGNSFASRNPGTFDDRYAGQDFASRYFGQDFASRYAGQDFDRRNPESFDERNNYDNFDFRTSPWANL